MFFFLGKDYNPCLTKRYTTGYLQYLRMYKLEQFNSVVCSYVTLEL